MSHPIFLRCVDRIATRSLPLSDLLVCCEALGEGQDALQAQLYRLWLHANAGDTLACVAHFNVSVVLERLGQSDGARQHLQEALALNPDLHAASINLGGLLERAGEASAGFMVWRTANERLDLITGETIAYRAMLLKQMSRVLLDRQDHAAAETLLTACLDVSPQARDVAEQYCASRLAQCKWPIATDVGRVTRRALVSKLHPLSLCAYTDDPLLHLAGASDYVMSMSPPAERDLSHDRRAASIPTDRPLRIGYVSSDLRLHAVGFLMAEVFELHDPAKVHVTAYYCGPPSTDPVTTRYRANVQQWRDITGQSDSAVAAQIAADEIDILVDVNGHTREARIGLFAMRPAPVIVNWLGYPGTMGSAFHNYLIADAQIVRPQDEVFYSEQVLRLPCYQPNDRKRLVSPDTPTRASVGLPETGFVFCCFNASHKITRFSFERWLAVLREVEGSCLWLLDYGETTNARLRAYAEAHGVDGARLVFAPKIINPLHMARIALADLVLDTAPYGAHTTASDALWMGVPVLTIAGRSFAARVCASLVHAAGLPDMVCESPEAYIQKAIALATTQRDQLDALRQRLREGRDTCTLFDTPTLVRHLEGLFEDMARRHREGATPQPDLTNLAAYFEIGCGLDHEGVERGFASSYSETYQNALAQRHAQEALLPDGRFWAQTAALPADPLRGAA